MNDKLKRIGVLAVTGAFGLLLSSLLGTYVVLGGLGLAFLLGAIVKKIIASR